jgi:NADH:ubiquinone oxidoreductase subunit K
MPSIESVRTLDLAALAVVFAVGLFTIISQRNMIKTIIGLEIMARGITLAFITSGYLLGQPGVAQAVTILVITIDATVVALALALMVNAHRHFGGLDLSKLTRLRG